MSGCRLIPVIQARQAWNVPIWSFTSAGWDSYPILRFTEVPKVRVRIVDAPGEAETGAGEIAQGPVAGAIGNAVAAAVGVRVRDLPLTRERVARAIQES